MTKGEVETRRLHRDVWEHYNKQAVPPGYYVHHIDHEPYNNDPSNLMVMSPSEHSAYHSQESFKSDDYRRKNKEQLDRVRPLLSGWHKSEEGLTASKKGAEVSWATREWTEKVCEECKEVFRTPFPERTTYCSQLCRQRCYARTKRYHTDERVCPYCNQPFIAWKYSGAKCCSRECANKLRVKSDEAA